MGHVMKSILSLLLALAIAASIGCVPAFADADGGNSNAEGGGAIQVTVIVGSAEAGQGTVTEVKVGGITIDESTPSAVCSGVSVTYAESGSSQTVTVGGPIETVDCAGLTINNENTGTPIIIEIKGDITGAAGETYEAGDLGTLTIEESADGGTISYLNKLNVFDVNTVNDWIDIL